MTERISIGQLYPNAVSPASTRRTPVAAAGIQFR